ncbi:VOC family protein [Streptacidiphilus sp. EB129]|jgi:predicted enzyme related to lactoylglutathione lyase|uniref:VOC family protein n=1 Tax=Streptacidiphilus sp. EB129 TaxID=3156262 RepID=UPI003512D6BC
MPEVNAPYAPGTPCWVDLMVPDQRAALDFYQDLFGWQGEPGPPETGGYAMCTQKGRPVAGIGPSMDPSTPTVWTTYLASDDADVTLARIESAGGKVLMPPMDVLKFGRMFVASDPAGAVFGVWGRGEFFGAQLVNEHGAITWNECNTRNADASAAFYHKAFGVDVTPMEQAPGYRTLDIGGRPVGGLQAMTEPPFIPEVPSHWMTYFAVEDTDTTVDQAVKTGASVILPPTDSPFGRVATLRDPWGAVFSVIRTEQPG